MERNIDYLSNLMCDKLFTEDLYENEKFVIIKVIRVINNIKHISIEKGIKDKYGDIVEFIKV